MAEHPQREGQQQPGPTTKGLLPDKGPSSSQVVAVVTLVPVGGVLLAISGITLVLTIIGLCLATPVFIIFSPVIVPAAITIALAVTGFLASGAFGITGLSSLSWIVSYMRGGRPKVTEPIDLAKRRMAEAVGQRAKDIGQGIQQKGQEGGGRT